MPIPLPNLDDRTYANLVAEAQALIPRIYPEWTNHNPSDPGVVMVEMLAWLTEMALFQVNEVTNSHTAAYLELLNGPEWELADDGELETAVHQTILNLRQRYRAITADDFNYLLFNIWPQTAAAQKLGAASEIARICCLPQCNLEAKEKTAVAPAHVSLVILPQHAGKAKETGDLLTYLAIFLEPRLLLTTIHHVVLPDFVSVTVQGRVYIREDVPLANADDVIDGPEHGLIAFFDAYTGGPDGNGWPFGRSVYASEIYAILSRLAVVDYVEDVTLEGNQQSSSVEIRLQPHQLVQIALSELVLVDVYGRELRIGD